MIFKKIARWLEERDRKLYERIIRKHSPEEQELIKRGRRVLLTPFSKDEFEKVTNLKTEPVYHGRHPYDKVCLFGIKERGCDVYYWLELGRMGADVMLDVPTMRVGPDAFQISIGQPARILPLLPRDLVNWIGLRYCKIGGTPEQLEERLKADGRIR